VTMGVTFTAESWTASPSPRQGAAKAEYQMTEHTHEWRDKEPPQWKRTPSSFGPIKWTETAFITRVCDCGAVEGLLLGRRPRDGLC